MSNSLVTIVGAGLAGSEAAWQIASRGIQVQLHEMRPARMTKAHKTGRFAELVCSNSLRGAALTNAVGLLKEELRRMRSLIMQAADSARVPAGGALAVDREAFSSYIDCKIRSHPLIKICTGELTEVPCGDAQHPVIVATGPLTSATLAADIRRITGAESLAFFDAISPIILGSSIDTDKVFRQSRYDKGGSADYLNVPMDRDLYQTFVRSVVEAEKFGAHDEVESDCIEQLRHFEGCMPIEDMAASGPETLRHGPLKPMGLRDPRTGRAPYAALQLRQDDSSGTLWSMVGMQTRMKHPEQIRVFRMLPGLESCEFVRLGSVHRNTFIDSPKCLNSTLQFRGRPELFFAGQITGVEGYVESTAAGLVAGVNAARICRGADPLSLPAFTATGALLNYISDPSRTDFQPMNISFGLIEGYAESAGGQKKTHPGGKDGYRLDISNRALNEIAAIWEGLQ